VELQGRLVTNPPFETREMEKVRGDYAAGRVRWEAVSRVFMRLDQV
jgi:hypothetical protein